jgi:hypothetical protein
MNGRTMAAGRADGTALQGFQAMTRCVPRPLLAALLLVMAGGLAGCGVVALPFRATSAVVKVVPVAGDVVAAPFDASAAVID